MVLKEFALLASDTVRTKAYLQAMVRAERLPGVCIVYSDHISEMEEDAERYAGKDNEYNYYFDIDIPVVFLIRKMRIPYIIVRNKDINSEEMEDVLRGLDQRYLIYSGYGGYILKPHLFCLDKKFVHVHAGILPQYRGSTTVYYSFLQERVMGATAIFLNEGIDEGEIIAQDVFEVPRDSVDIDYIYDPYIRSRVLIKAIEQYIERGELISREQGTDGAETYYIIHPVLKHLAMLSIERYQRETEKENR